MNRVNPSFTTTTAPCTRSGIKTPAHASAKIIVLLDVQARRVSILGTLVSVLTIWMRLYPISIWWRRITSSVIIDTIIVRKLGTVYHMSGVPSGLSVFLAVNGIKNSVNAWVQRNSTKFFLEKVGQILRILWLLRLLSLLWSKIVKMNFGGMKILAFVLKSLRQGSQVALLERNGLIRNSLVFGRKINAVGFNALTLK